MRNFCMGLSASFAMWGVVFQSYYLLATGGVMALVAIALSLTPRQG